MMIDLRSMMRLSTPVCGGSPSQPLVTSLGVGVGVAGFVELEFVLSGTLSPHLKIWHLNLIPAVTAIAATRNVSKTDNISLFMRTSRVERCPEVLMNRLML